MSDDFRVTSPDEAVVPTEREAFADADFNARESTYDRDDAGHVRIDEGTTLIDSAPTPGSIEALLDDDTRPIERFLLDLESKLLRGGSLIQIRAWARREHGIKGDSFDRYVQITKATWKIETLSPKTLTDRRDESRQLYREIYREALVAAEIEPKHLGIALKAVEAMDRLDGLSTPDITINVGAQADLSASTQEELTNKTRERTMLLIHEMQRRAERHAASAARSIEDARRLPQSVARDDDGVIIESLDPLAAPSPMVMRSIK